MDQSVLEGRIAILKNFYFYLVSFVALMMVVIALSDMVSIVLKAYVFTKADNFNYYSTPMNCDPAYIEPNVKTDPSLRKLTPEECEKNKVLDEKRNQENMTSQRQSSLVRDIGMLVVSIPLFVLHWGVVRRSVKK